MQARPLLLAAAAAALVAWAPSWSQPATPPAPAPAAVELAGVKFPTRTDVDGRKLQLNGAGIRYKFVFKVYAAGLYLAGRAATPQAVLAEPGPKRLQVVMLRDIDSRELGKLFTRGMEENSTMAEFAPAIPGTLRMADIFSSRKKLVAGDSFSVDWIPGQGTRIVVDGQAQGEPIKEPEFFAALMRIWLGPKPADARLKQALLGAGLAPAGSAAQP